MNKKQKDSAKKSSNEEAASPEKEAGIIEKKITDSLKGAFDETIESRKKYYADNPDQLPSQDNVSRIISAYTRNNAIISGGASLIPGPWGMAAVVPELTVVIRNQIRMIYDIGTANGKQEQLTKELLMGIFITALGSSAGSLLTIHGGKILVRQVSLRAMQKLITLLGGKITQQALKSSVSKWLPGVGAAAMATWTGYMTKQIGKRANELFQFEIDDDPKTLDIEIAEGKTI